MSETEVDIDLDRLVIFDLETTGLESDCRIVQIAITRGEKIFQSLINPGMPIPPESTEIHRITDEDVKDAPVFADVVDQVLDFIEGGVLSGFNIRKFDVPVLKREVEAVGKKLPPLPMLDLFELNQKMNPRSLAWFFKQYTGKSMDSEEAHDAVYDCICTRRAFMGMFAKHEELPKDLDELAMFAEPERVPVAGCDWLVWTANQSEPTFARGKYRGWALSDVGRKESSYLDWLNSIDADAASKNIINLYRGDRKAYVAMLLDEHPLRLEPRYLEFRLAMDLKRKEDFEKLAALADKTQDPSLTFLAAAWGYQLKKDEATEYGKRYLTMDDPNVNMERRANFLKNVLKL